METAAVLPAPASDAGSWAQVERLLTLARVHLGMDVAWMTQFADGQQVVRVASADTGVTNDSVGDGRPLDGSFCVRVLAGTLPPVITDARRHPVTRELAVTSELGIGSYVGVPWRGADGQAAGMLCCLSRAVRPELDSQAERFLALVAELISEHVGGQPTTERCAAEQDSAKVREILEAGAVRMVFQPIVSLADGGLLAYEALARFDHPDLPTPAHAFAAATRAGLGVELELLAARSAFARLGDVPPGIGLGVNLSAEALLTPHVEDVLLERGASRQLAVELTEHTQVADYTALVEVTERLRSAGVEIVVDDAGAGYASLRHILQLRPDAIKLDIAIIRGVDIDPVRQALTRSLVGFAADIGARLVAEGIEFESEHAVLRELGVKFGQGYLMAKPGPLPPR